jgi:large subunit ribosomal protein L9
MRIVLRTDVENVGKKGDIIEVADGFARNYLIPKGRAIAATKGVQSQADAMRRSRDKKDTADREAAEVVARTLVPTVITISAKAGAEGKLFGSVTTTELAESVQAQTGIELDRRRIHLDEPIRSIGIHEVPVKLHADVEFRLTVEVSPAG